MWLLLYSADCKLKMVYNKVSYADIIFLPAFLAKDRSQVYINSSDNIPAKSRTACLVRLCYEF